MKNLSHQQIVDKYKGDWFYDISAHQAHINYEHLFKLLPKPSKGSLVFCDHEGYGIVLNVEDIKYEIFFIASQQISIITDKYGLLKLNVVE